jgi:hypothetical protein
LSVENKADWALLSGADEFLESPYRGLRLGEAIRLEAQKGYNLIQFDNFEFWPTEKDHDIPEKDVRKRLRYYSWHDDFQFRCYKVYPGTSIDESAGHTPTFPNGIAIKVSPNKFVLRHYKIRSYDHGLRKVFHERLSRYSPELRKMGWHVHYNNFGTERNYFIIDRSKLTRYEEDGNWSLTKTFDGSFGTWNPPTVIDQLHEKGDKIREIEEELRKRDSEIAALHNRIRELEEELRKRDSEITALHNTIALRLARMIPFRAHIRKLFAPRRRHSY